MQLDCDYILQINTVGHMTIFYPKGEALYVQGNSMNMFLTSKV